MCARGEVCVSVTVLVVAVAVVMWVPQPVAAYDASLHLDGPAPATCEPIQVEACRGLGYSLTSMPNLVGQERQRDAAFTLATFQPLVQFGCAPRLRLLLCAVLVPLCTRKVATPIGPCRSLCLAVRARCFPVLRGFGFQWPSLLNCSKFPLANNHETMCMEGPLEDGEDLPDGGGSSSSSSGTAPSSSASEPGAAAAAAAAAAARAALAAWTALWAALALASSPLAAVSLLLLDGRRWRRRRGPALAALAAKGEAGGAGTPGRERALLSLALSCAAHALACALGLALVPSDAACAPLFLLDYVALNSQHFWWAAACGARWAWAALGGGGVWAWACAAALAWGAPAALGAAALALRLVQRDPLAGACVVGLRAPAAFAALVVAPQALCLCAGLCLWAASAARPGQGGGGGGGAGGGGVGAVGPLGAVPLACLVGAGVCEWALRARGEAPPLWLALLKALASLAPGVTALLWAAAPSTLRAWRRLCRRIGPRYKPAPIKEALPAHTFQPALHAHASTHAPAHAHAHAHAHAARAGKVRVYRCCSAAAAGVSGKAGLRRGGETSV